MIGVEVLRWEPRHESRREPVTLHVAVVVAADGIRFVAAEPDDERLARRLGEYVRAHAAVTLWPEDARRVHDALAAGETGVAVEAYFAAVGQRWDPESIVRTRVAVDPVTIDR